MALPGSRSPLDRHAPHALRKAPHHKSLFPVSPSGKVRITASYYTLRKAKWKTVTARENNSSIQVSLPVRQTIPILGHGSVPAEWRGKQLCGGKEQW